MSRSIVLKFLAFLLAACALVSVAGSLLGIVVLGKEGLYDQSLDDWQTEKLTEAGTHIGNYVAQGYASVHLGNCPDTIDDYSLWTYYPEDTWSATLMQDGKVLAQVGAELTDAYEMTVTPTGSYWEQPQPGQDLTGEDTTNYASYEDGKYVYYTFINRPLPDYTVQVFVHPDCVRVAGWDTLELLYSHRTALLVILVAGLLMTATCVVYLCWAAGRSPGNAEIRPVGLNRLPLDLYALGAGGLIVAGLFFGAELASWTFSYTDDVNKAGLFLGTLLALVLCLIALAFLYAVAAQVKVRCGYWLRNTLIGRGFRRLKSALRRLGHGIAAFFDLLPMLWQWLLVAGGLALAGFISIIWSLDSMTLAPVYLFLLLCCGVLGYIGWCFATLLAGVQEMTQGKLEHTVSTRFLLGSFREFAVGLNALSGCAVEAAQKQLRAERMKTELITNVSHDIKTPLTSIINYADLLQKPHTPDENIQYLEVLSRQSLVLKKLIDDLMELSKASTGNLAVEIETVDGVEAINQALGEYSDKFAAAGLTPVFEPEQAVMPMLADGRLLWRILSNLLGNAAKYALPGTRIYLDMVKLEDQVMISVKNVSRERLSRSAGELLERFVRDDDARNTEGSGLGLNIAKSLAELQHAQLQLMVDGDLFKVTLYFPAAAE